MAFAVRLVIQRVAGHTYSNTWIQSCNIKIAEMVEAKKTNGDLVPARINNQFNRFFADIESAQEFIDWWNNSDSPPNATFQIIEL